jgi:hypothetical protein
MLPGRVVQAGNEEARLLQTSVVHGRRQLFDTNLPELPNVTSKDSLLVLALLPIRLLQSSRGKRLKLFVVYCATLVIITHQHGGLVMTT